MNSFHRPYEKVESNLWGGTCHAGTPPAISAFIAKFSPVLTGKLRRLNQVIRIGFVALTDCAPLVMASELGLFEEHGLTVELSREIGWATIREKVTYGELEAAHAPAGLLLAAVAGLGGIRAACLTGIVLNLHGNAITLSQRLWEAGVRDGGTLREHVRRTRRPLTLGYVCQWSSHPVLLRFWLSQHGLDLARDVEFVVVPPSQVVRHLGAGHLDGFCVGEPWNSLAVMAGSGWVVARSAEIAPSHPEKVLMVHEDFANRMDQQHTALIAALLESAHFCDEPANRDRIVATLARPEYVGSAADAIRRGMQAHFDFGNGRVEQCPGFSIFARDNAARPDAEKAEWVARGLVSSGLAKASELPRRTAVKCFREDIFARAVTLAKPALIPSAA